MGNKNHHTHLTAQKPKETGPCSYGSTGTVKYAILFSGAFTCPGEGSCKKPDSGCPYNPKINGNGKKK